MKPGSAVLPVEADPHLKQVPAGDRVVPPSRRPIDLVHLTRQTFGDKRLEIELLRLFMRQSGQIQKSLDSLEDDRPAVSTLELVHMLSGSARAIGATEIAATAGEAEARMRRLGLVELDAEERAGLSELIKWTNRYIAEIIAQG